MLSPFNLRGFVDDDPLDRAPTVSRYLLAMAVTLVVTFAFLWWVYFRAHIAILKWPWLFWAEIGLFTLVFAPMVVALRKCSSIVPVALFVVLALSLDFWIEDHVRARGLQAWWMYDHASFVGKLPPLARSLVVWVGDGLVEAPLCLWLSRLVAKLFWPRWKKDAPPTREQYQRLFPEAQIDEKVDLPHRFSGTAAAPGWGVHDGGFLLLRGIGLAYFGYMLLVMLGATGVAAFPPQVRELLQMSYDNPALTINTFMKIVTMAMVAFIGAYNRSLRWHCGIVLLVGHGISTASSLFFYYFVPDASHRTFLLTSAEVDFVFIVLLAWMMVNHRDLAGKYREPKEFPEFFSIPQQLSQRFFNIFGIACALLVPLFLFIRLFGNGHAGVSAVYGYPDPQLCNTLTKYGALSVMGLLMSTREELREEFYGVLIATFGFSVVCSSLWLVLGDMFTGLTIATRGGGSTRVDWHFMGNVILDGSTLAILLALRKMYYDVDLTITALSPAGARNVMALHEAIYLPVYRAREARRLDENLEATVAEDNGHIVTSIDRHIAGIRGRKRGLFNFPFWLLENVIGLVMGLRPGFSTMSPEERAWLLRRRVLRPPHERARSMIPPLAEVLYKLGSAAHAFVTLAHYSHLKGRENIYVPPEARDRLQGDYPSSRPPFKKIAKLPTGPDDAENERPGARSDERPLIAPRVVTAVREPAIPRSVDYLVIGSGAGGAVMAYRLACESPGERILVIERGPRYSPIHDFNDDEMEMVRKLYKEGGLQQTKRFDLIILQGECVGGSTVINNAICVPPPDDVMRRWRGDFGLEQTLTGLEDELARVGKEIEIQPIWDRAINERVEARFSSGTGKYNEQKGWDRLKDVEKLLANHRNQLGTAFCNIGDKRMRKRSMLETYLPWAAGRGVRIVSETTAVRFNTDRSGKRATSVVLRTSMGRLIEVEVKKGVIVAGGVIASSHFLFRSGVGGHVGEGVACNFGLPLIVDFDERLDAFDGVQITVAAEDPKNRAIFESYFNPPGAFAISVPFYFDRHHSVMARYRHLMNLGALVGSEPNGHIERAPDPIAGRSIRWTLGDTDRANIKFALKTQLRLAQMAGGIRAMVPMEPAQEIPLETRTVESFADALDAYPLRMADLRLMTAHPQGGNRMTADQSGTVGPDFRVRGYDNVYVADASIFPSGITVNPQWTIMALSSLCAKRVLSHG